MQFRGGVELVGDYSTEDLSAEVQGNAIQARVQIDCDIPLHLQTRQWLDFSNPRLYPEILPRLVESIEKQIGVAVAAESLVRYNNAPALPENYVSRPELLEALRNTLFTEGANRNITHNIAHLPAIKSSWLGTVRDGSTFCQLKDNRTAIS